MTGEWPAQGTIKALGLRATQPALHWHRQALGRLLILREGAFCFSPEAGPACRAGMLLLRALGSFLEVFNALSLPRL